MSGNMIDAGIIPPKIITNKFNASLQMPYKTVYIPPFAIQYFISFFSVIKNFRYALS